MCVKMKFLVLTLVIVLCQNHNVNCSFMEFMAARFSDLANTVTSTLLNLKNQMKTLFGTPNRQMVSPTPIIAVRKRITTSTSKDTQNKKHTDLTEFTNLKPESINVISTPQLALLHSKQMESHAIISDGYILTIHRIISPKLKTPPRYSNHTVLLHHGLLGSATDWILLGPMNSLPYMLSKAGYDVWMVNARGNYFSRGHISRKLNSTEFWNFSWQEMGEFDLAAIVDYIRKLKNITNNSVDKIDYIGHSMGATALLVLLSTLPNYNDYLRIGILLAPLAYMSNAEGPLRSVMTMESNPMKQLLNVIGTTEFVPSRKLPKWIALKYCKGPLLFCCNPLYFISGGIPSTGAWNISFISRLLYHVPTGASTNTILHYIQLMKTGSFHRFNKVDSPFNLSKISLPIALISSDHDWLATTPDVLKLYLAIPNPVDHYIIRGRNFSHTEFVWGPGAPQLVFNKVFEYLDNSLIVHTFKGNEIQLSNP